MTKVGLALACLIIAGYIALEFPSVAADSHVNFSQPRATKFQFARMRYPGGIPEYIKNWYTDYPAMDQNLTALLRRLTGIDVAPPVLVDPSSRDIFNYPLVYSVEPEQMALGTHEISNLRDYLSRGGIWFADDFHGDEEFDQFLKQIHRVIPGASPVELDTSQSINQECRTAAITKTACPFGTAISSGSPTQSKSDKLLSGL